MAQYNITSQGVAYSFFQGAQLFILNNSFLFISTKYNTTLSESDFVNFNNTIFRISHSGDFISFPEKEILNEIFQTFDDDEFLSFIKPIGNSVKKFDLHTNDYESFIFPHNIKSNDNESYQDIYSFIFYTCGINKKLSSHSDAFLQAMKNSLYGNTTKYVINSELDEIEINDYYSMYAAKTGIGLFNIDTYSSDFKQESSFFKLYLSYLKCLKEIIHFEIKTKDFNRELDNAEYKNLDNLITEVHKEMRNAVHLKYDIRNSLKMNSIRKIFFGKYLTAIDFTATLSEFIDICHSIESELKAKVAEREETHDKYFDKILSVVAIFAIVSVFKDGSDLLLSFIDAIQNGGLSNLDLSKLIVLGVPIICVLVIITIMTIFRKKKK